MSAKCQRPVVCSGATMTASKPAVSLALAAGLLALGPGTASAGLPDPPVYVYSAKSGELGGGRLMLHGVSRRITWATQGGRSGLTSIRRLHRLLFTPSTPRATATLHVAGQQGGEELVLRLSRPRYKASRRTVRYRVKRLKGTLPSRRRFGAASLSIVAPQVPEGAPTGNQCRTSLMNEGAGPLELVAHSTPSDTWDTEPPFGPIDLDVSTAWASHGAAGQGCSNTVTYKVLANPPVAFTIETTYPVSGAPTYTCTRSLPGNPQYFCEMQHAPAGGVASWQIGFGPAPPPAG
jgi:hypothetical protein